MKKYISQIVLALVTMILAGCSKHSPTASTHRAVDLVQAGKDVEFGDGFVVHVTKREGSSVEGIHVHFPHSDGPASEITAETGTIEPGIPDYSDYENQLMYDKNQVTIWLYNATNVTGTTNQTFSKQELVLYYKKQL
jgi:hypothetical protein